MMVVPCYSSRRTLHNPTLPPKSDLDYSGGAQEQAPADSPVQPEETLCLPDTFGNGASASRVGGTLPRLLLLAPLLQVPATQTLYAAEATAEALGHLITGDLSLPRRPSDRQAS